MLRIETVAGSVSASWTAVASAWAATGWLIETIQEFNRFPNEGRAFSPSKNCTVAICMSKSCMNFWLLSSIHLLTIWHAQQTSGVNYKHFQWLLNLCHNSLYLFVFVSVNQTQTISLNMGQAVTKGATAAPQHLRTAGIPSHSRKLFRLDKDTDLPYKALDRIGAKETLLVGQGSRWISYRSKQKHWWIDPSSLEANVFHVWFPWCSKGLYESAENCFRSSWTVRVFNLYIGSSIARACQSIWIKAHFRCSPLPCARTNWHGWMPWCCCCDISQ